MRVFYNHPEFIGANAERVREAWEKLPEHTKTSAHLAFTAHSIPSSMAVTSDYERQLQETCRLVAEAVDVTDWKLVYQSRSGRPTDPWLEPDILDHLKTLHAAGASAVVVHPIGFLSDHMEVLFDLDEEAKQLCDSLGLPMVRAASVGTHPRFVGLLRELIIERLFITPEKRAIGAYGASHDVCPVDCCPARRGRRGVDDSRHLRDQHRAIVRGGGVGGEGGDGVEHGLNEAVGGEMAVFQDVVKTIDAEHGAAVGSGGFRDAVRVKDDLIVGVKDQGRLVVFHLRVDAQRQVADHVERVDRAIIAALQARRVVAGTGIHQRAGFRDQRFHRTR